MLMNSKWITYATGEYKDENARYGNPSPYFRKSFKIYKSVDNVRLFISALGVFKVYVNGCAASNDCLAPGWVDYSKKLPLIEYDITGKISEKNAVGVVLGDGWAVGHIGSNYTFKRNCWSDRIEFCAEIRIRYTDGTDEVIGTDNSWRATSGEILRSDIYMGEYTDARRSLGNYSVFEYDDSAWEDAEETIFKFSRNLYLWKMPIPPVTVRKVFKCNKIFERGNVCIYDVGQNIAGVLQCAVKGDAGAKIIIRHGEVLDGERLYTENLRKAEATDTYVLAGGRREIFRPLFTYHGFQFAEIKKIGRVEIDCVIAEAMSCRLERSGDFKCSDEVVNKIYENALWSMTDNFFSVPTDCPQRDERLGWLGDAQIISRSAMYNFDCERYFDKYLADIRDAQLGNGAVPAVAPLPRVGYYTYSGRNSCGGWSEAPGEISYNHYRMYGDKKIIRENLSCLKALLSYYEAESGGCLRKGENSYGDWLCIGEPTDKSLIANLYYARAAWIAQKLCAEIGDYEQSRYSELYEKIKKAIRERFWTRDARFVSDTQSAYVIAYKTGIITDKEARGNIKRRLREDNMHITCGFLGIRFLLPTLCDLGMSDEAYDILTQRTYPGWGYSVTQGATTIWEHWDSNSKDKLKEMNSFNHYSLGSCVEWMYEYCLGIRADNSAAGFERVFISPYICRNGKITSVSGSYISKHGRISVDWKTEDDACRYSVTLPDNMSVEYTFDGFTVKDRIIKGNTTEFILNVDRGVDGDV